MDEMYLSMYVRLYCVPFLTQAMSSAECLVDGSCNETELVATSGSCNAGYNTAIGGEAAATNIFALPCAVTAASDDTTACYVAYTADCATLYLVKINREQ